MAIILNEKDLARLYETPAALDELLKLIEEAFGAHSRKVVAGLARVETSLTDPKRRYRIMTAAVPQAGFGMRINALFQGAKDSYFHLLFDDRSGDLMALIAGRELNIWRTGAPSGVACRFLAPADVRTLGFIGSGHQARGQLAAIRRAMPSLRRVRVFSRTAAHREIFAKEMSAWLDIAIEPVNNPRAAIQDAPLVAVATNSRTPVLEAGWITPGSLVVSITGGQLPQQLVTGSRVIVSWKEEVLAGEVPRQPYAAMIAAGTWSGDKIAGELGDVILGKIPAREKVGETVLFESVGMPLWDTTACAWAYRWATAQEIGTPFSLD